MTTVNDAETKAHGEATLQDGRHAQNWPQGNDARYAVYNGGTQINDDQLAYFGEAQASGGSAGNAGCQPDAGDTFTDADNTNIENHSPDVGGPWARVQADGTTAIVAGAMFISNNALDFSAGGQAAVINTGNTDFDISVDYTPGAGSRNGIVMRYVSNGNCLSFRCRAANDAIELIKWTAGTLTTDDSATFTFTDGQTYRLRAVGIGSSITCYIDGVEVLSATVTSHAAGVRHGLLSFGTDYSEVLDNFIVANINTVSVAFNKPVTFTEATLPNGVVISATGGKTFSITAASGTGTAVVTYTGSWSAPLQAGDEITWTYTAANGDYTDGSTAMLDNSTQLANCLI